MDIVEDFLELGKNASWLKPISKLKCQTMPIDPCFCTCVNKHDEVSVTTLVDMLKAIRKRVPPRYLPRLGDKCLVNMPVTLKYTVTVYSAPLVCCLPEEKSERPCQVGG